MTTRPRRSRSPSIVLVLACLVMSCSNTCESCGKDIGSEAAGKITDAVNKSVAQLPAIIKQIDDLIAHNIGAIDATLAHQIQQVNKLLKENIDGINAALQETIDNIDAMLAARLQQLFTFAKEFLRELDDIFAKRINQLTHSAEKLIKTLEVSGTELLETAGFQVVRTIQEGNKVVAVVVGGAVEVVVLVSAGLVMLVVVVLAGIFYIRQRRLAAGDKGKLQAWQLGLGAGFFALVFGVATLMVFVPSARASIAAGRVPISQDNMCASVVPDAGIFFGENNAAGPGSLGEEKSQVAAKLLGGLYQCMAEGTGELRSKARVLAAKLEHLIGVNTRCTRNEDCTNSAEHCQLEIGLCTARCEGPHHCPAGQVCHSPDTVGICGSPCSATSACNANLVCSTGGVCDPAPPPTTTPPTTTPGIKKPPHMAGGIIDDIIVKPGLGCPGPRCPLDVCKKCGVIDPAPPDRGVFRPTDATGPVGPDRRTRPDARIDVRKLDMSRFYDPRLKTLPR